MVQILIRWRFDTDADPEHGVERSHRIEPAVEAEDVFVQIGLQVLRTDPYEYPRATFSNSRTPSGSSAESCRSLPVVASDDYRFMAVAECCQPIVADPAVGRHRSPRLDGGGNEWTQRLTLAVGNHLEPQPSRVHVAASNLCADVWDADDSRTSTAPATSVLW